VGGCPYRVAPTLIAQTGTATKPPPTAPRDDPYPQLEMITRPSFVRLVFSALVVVTYEGRSFSGVPTKNCAKRMPGICQHLGVECRTLPEGLARLGASF
jgi:hypothetical protein